MASLYELSSEVKKIYDDLSNGVGIDEETGEIKEDVIQALQLTQQDLQTKAIDYGYVIKSFDDEISLYEREIERLTNRKKQLKKTQERIKDTLLGAMEQFDIKEIKGQTLRLMFRKSEQVKILDETLLDERFIKTKIETTIDKIAIKQAIKNGEDVQGAIIEEKQNLQIK